MKRTFGILHKIGRAKFTDVRRKTRRKMIVKQIKIDPSRVAVGRTSPCISRTNGRLLFLVLSLTFTHETSGHVAAAIGYCVFSLKIICPHFPSLIRVSYRTCSWRSRMYIKRVSKPPGRAVTATYRLPPRSAIAIIASAEENDHGRRTPLFVIEIKSQNHVTETLKYTSLSKRAYSLASNSLFFNTQAFEKTIFCFFLSMSYPGNVFERRVR